MPPVLALILCGGLVAALLSAERGRNPEASPAVWIPTLWLLLSGAKPLGRWFEPTVGMASEEAGSLPDRLLLSALIILALLVIHRRRVQWSRVANDNIWLVILFLYLGASVVWSDFPFVSFKRWIRLAGAIPVAMVVMSERSPLKALESCFRRCAYVLIPFSILLIKYFPAFGVEYSREGIKMWVGVASQKNSLGVICALSAFLIVWTFLRERRAGTFLRARPQALADGLVLCVAVYLLTGFRGVYPATAIGILLAGTVSLLFLRRAGNNVRRAAAFLVIMTVVGLLSLFYGDSLVSIATSAFNRDESFTGRSDIWDMVLGIASRNPWLGVGYGGYWGLQDETVYAALGVRESHSGYLDVYLEVGLVGILLLMAFLRSFYRQSIRQLGGPREWGLFGVCLLIMSLIHGFTESNFLRTAYLWSAMVFATVVFSGPLPRDNTADGRAARGIGGEKPSCHDPLGRRFGGGRGPVPLRDLSRGLIE
ncbi:MAG: hypothetical protein Kow0025_05080 [Thermodesulfovibrionales bacterium]